MNQIKRYRYVIYPHSSDEEWRSVLKDKVSIEVNEKKPDYKTQGYDPRATQRTRPSIEPHKEPSSLYEDQKQTNEKWCLPDTTMESCLL